jgi:hypothetical protein
MISSKKKQERFSINGSFPYEPNTKICDMLASTLSGYYKCDRTSKLFPFTTGHGVIYDVNTFAIDDSVLQAFGVKIPNFDYKFIKSVWPKYSNLRADSFSDKYKSIVVDPDWEKEWNMIADVSVFEYVGVDALEISPVSSTSSHDGVLKCSLDGEIKTLRICGRGEIPQTAGAIEQVLIAEIDDGTVLRPGHSGTPVFSSDNRIHSFVKGSYVLKKARVQHVILSPERAIRKQVVSCAFVEFISRYASFQL